MSKITRKERTKLIRDVANNAWLEEWWAFIKICFQKHQNEMSPFWSHYITTMELINSNPDIWWNWTKISSSSTFVNINTIKSNINKPWDWPYISCHDNISLQDISDNPELPWVWNHNKGGVSKNPNLTMEFIDAHPDKQWNWPQISEHPNLTIEFVKDNMDKQWDWCKISYNKNISLDDIAKNPDLQWNWHYISQREDLTVEYIKSNQDKPWNFLSISWNTKIPINFIIQTKNYNWWWDVIFANREKPREITIDIINANPDFKWDWEYISTHPNITMKDIEENLNYPWVWGHNGISQNPNLTIDFINTHYDKPFDWCDISKYAKMSDIINNPLLPWDWTYMSYNRNITIEFIKSNIDKPWDWTEGLSQRYDIEDYIIAFPEQLAYSFAYYDAIPYSNISMKFIKANLNCRWRWNMLGDCIFTGDETNCRIKIYRRHLAVYRIQQWWHRIRSDHRHPVGLRRLEREYDRLFVSI